MIHLCVPYGTVGLREYLRCPRVDPQGPSRCLYTFRRRPPRETSRALMNDMIVLENSNVGNFDRMGMRLEN